MLEQFKEQILEANLELVRKNLVVYTWGNVSGLDRETGLIVIKPSGVPYERMKAEHMVVLDPDGQVREGSLRPSSDASTHLVLYRKFPEIGGVVHTHSPHATAWAQANHAIPAFGTTHADYFHGPVPCTRRLSPNEVQGEYEVETGHVICETLDRTGESALALPGVLVASHGPFTWGRDAFDAVHNAVVLEEVARMAWMTLQIHPGATEAARELIEKHYLRKHGAGAYYGQPKESGV